ncbi:hypothetical protein C942_00697 [Photobacterium marinum]|uniref:Uncharacterized protein n=1 Tax=Photobacterium marinum TaxID=1056511 RepID=L8JDK8_9GAMM|nr:hypothetical protein [Photobacterium marinum]ELR65614.1 hypothetical protein C942_00697 [Photobacterium marinum]
MDSLKNLFISAVITISSYSYSIEINDILLPFNEYSALRLLAKSKVSTIQLPALFNSDINDIYGEDKNNNQFRDDYEAMLLSNYQHPEYVAMGLLSAKHWKLLLDIHNNNLTITDKKHAKAILELSLEINHCYYHLQRIDKDLHSPLLSYFNTEQRLTAKKDAEQKLFSLIGKQQESRSHERLPCEVFSTMLSAELDSAVSS